MPWGLCWANVYTVQAEGWGLSIYIKVGSQHFNPCVPAMKWAAHMHHAGGMEGMQGSWVHMLGAFTVVAMVLLSLSLVHLCLLERGDMQH